MQCNVSVPIDEWIIIIDSKQIKGNRSSLNYQYLWNESDMRWHLSKSVSRTKPDYQIVRPRMVWQLACHSVWACRHLSCKQSGTPHSVVSRQGPKTKIILKQNKSNNMKKIITSKPNLAIHIYSLVFKAFKILRTPENFLNYKFINTV